MSSLWYVKGISLTGLLMNYEASNSFNEERLGRPVSPPCPAIAPPSSPRSSPRLPGSLVLIDDHFDGSLTENQVHLGEESTEGGRCTYIFCTISCTAGNF
jgi:hypothetical protein